MFTVIGAQGFIGRHVAACVRALGMQCYTPLRGEQAVFERPLGHVVYAAGLSADFRVRSFDTIEGHVTYAADILRSAQFTSFLYLSSTRVYAGAASTEEDVPLRVQPNSPDQLYNISKIAGESLALALPRATVRVVRLSNVYGDDLSSGMQMSDVLHAAARDRAVRFTASLESAKDYLWVEDAARILVEIAQHGNRRLYNVASGTNLSNRELGDVLASLTGATISVVPDAPTTVYPSIAIERVRGEFAFEPAAVRAVIPKLLPLYGKATAPS